MKTIGFEAACFSSRSGSAGNVVHFQAFRNAEEKQAGQIRRTWKWLHPVASARLTGQKARSA
ncbi:MAG: hypothetical protein AAGF82_19400, partial [Pseudomonadota bacterium]